MDSSIPPPDIAALTAWQQEFVNQFLSQPRSRSLLVAAAGTGKTTAALLAANKMLEHGVIDSMLVISDRVMLRDQWRHVASRYGMELENSLESHLGRHGVSATLQSLRTKDAEARVDAAARARRWLIIADDPGYETKSLVSLVDHMLSVNKENRALFIARDVPSDLSFEAEFRFRTEFILDRAIIEAPATEIRVARFAPSFSLLRQLQRGPAAIRWTVVARVRKTDCHLARRGWVRRRTNARIQGRRCRRRSRKGSRSWRVFQGALAS